jgi:hypothetical protein
MLALVGKVNKQTTFHNKKILPCDLKWVKPMGGVCPQNVGLNSWFFFQFWEVYGVVIIHKRTYPNLATWQKIV